MSIRTTLILLAGALAVTAFALGQRLEYPKSRKADVVDVLHGTSVEDPYRWLEDTGSAETRAWVAAQNKVTFGYLAKITERAAIKKRLTKIWNYERFGTPFKKGGRYFFSKNDGLQNQSVLFVAESLRARPRVLLDPNKLSKDGTVALGGIAISENGKLMAYSLQKSGSDWQEWKVRNVDTGRDLKDHILWSKFSGASWTADGKGFFYSRYDEPKGAALQEQNYFQKLYYHRIGTPQSQDELTYERKDEKEWGFDGSVTDDGSYLIISVWKGTEPKNQVFYKDLRAPGGKVIELIRGFEASFNFVTNVGERFLFHTDSKAPMGKLIEVDTRKPSARKTLIPEAKANLEGVGAVGGKLFAQYLKDAHSQIEEYTIKGKKIREIALPGLGSAGGFGGDFIKDKETFYAFTGFMMPNTIFRYDIRTGKSTVWKRPKVDFDPSRFETKQVFYRSKDGTKIPMFITYRKGLKLNGQNPTLLYGYGGFRSSETPYFSVVRTVWMELGGVYAVANLRGGGEYGKAWHDAGRLKNKQNVFDDFIAAAEYLIAKKYTSTPKLAINGGSNGGLLVGAVLNQRPDLFGAAVPEVGVMDMLRFHKFTIGWAWTSDYGSPDDPEMFKVLYKYSPYHNIKMGGKYPPTLVMTADTDDRVVPSHSFKYIARLQESQAGASPVLIRVETKAGHGGGKPTAKIIEEIADVYGFLVKSLGMKLPPKFGM